MSMQKKTLAVLVALSVGASFGAAAGGYGGGWGWGDDDAGGDTTTTTNTNTNTNDDGNQAVDHSAVIDVDYKRLDISSDYRLYDIDLSFKVNKQKNVTIQYGHTGSTESSSTANAASIALGGNHADATQRSTNTGAGLGLGLGVGLGAGMGEGGDGTPEGGSPPSYGPKHGPKYGSDYGSGSGANDADGTGFGLGAGAGVGAGTGLGLLVADQDLDQRTNVNATTNVFSVSMIKSGNNTLGNSGATHGINVQQANTGHSSMGQQSVNVNASVQF